MKLDLRIAITALWLIAQIPLTSAATYYFSSSGNDTNSGTSAAAPWRSLSQIYFKSAGIGGRTPFQPGDSILLRAGDTFEQTISCFSAGTSNEPITIGRYGAGANPIIHADNPSVTWLAVSNHTGVYSATSAFPSTIVRVYDTNGTQYTRLDKGADTLDVWLGKFQTNNWGFTFDTPSLIYIRTPDDSPPPQMRLFQYSAVGIAADYLVVENLDIRRSYCGIVANSARGFVIRSNSIQDTLSMGIFCGRHCSYGEIAGNVITRGGWTLLYFQTGGNNWAHHNTISYSSATVLGIAVNGKERCGIGLERGTNNLVEHNTISHVDMSCVDYWLEVSTTVRFNYGFHAGGAAYPHGTGLQVHHNIFNVDGGRGFGGAHSHDPTKSPAPDAGINLIYNNVVYNFVNYGIYSGTNASSGIQFRNNILVTASTNAALALLHDGMNAEQNLYFCTAGSPKGWYWNNTKYPTLAAFQAASGQEAHALYADPQFVSDNPVTAADFKLRSTSPGINAGQDLKAAGLIPPSQEYKDYRGTLIPQGFRPEIGAYEIPAPDPPTKVRPTE
ncbi:MAG: right-handed parallel beta-helix repeat-containing protein [Verrucomicrobiae bacterium]|nr:right-handed parallel beta-helix repeat-containing protein [Verrucomicrobiae bacterium]